MWLPQTKQVSLRQCSNQFYVIQQVLAQYDFRFHGKIRVMKNRFNIKNHLINQFICKKIDQLVWLIFHNCCFLLDYIFLKSEFSKNGVSKGLAVHIVINQGFVHVIILILDHISLTKSFFKIFFNTM